MAWDKNCPKCGLRLGADEWKDYALAGDAEKLPGFKCPECWAELAEGELVVASGNGGCWGEGASFYAGGA